MMQLNRLNFGIFTFILFLSISACNDPIDGLDNGEIDSGQYEDSVSDASNDNYSRHDESSDYSWNESEIVYITLADDAITIDGDGASASGSILTISSVGTYQLSGSLSNGQVYINTNDEGIVRLLFNNVSITNTSSAPVFIKNSPKTLVVSLENTENTLTDASTYVYASSDEDEPNATLFSKDDLTLYGDGKLTLNGKYNDAINCKDGLIIKSGNLAITAVDDGIRGKDYVIIDEGTVQITAGGDGIKSDNDEDSERGYIEIASGTFSITAEGDGLQAETDLLVSYADMEITTGGGSSYSVNYDESAKGLKAVVNLIVESGNFTLNTADDALHANGKITLNDGNYNIASNDDGIHADDKLVINGGTIDITKSYEGLEAQVICINDGTIHLQSSDDGINAAGGSNFFYMNGGYVYANANGDGIDINGSAEMTAGTILVDGPTSSGNGAIDYDGTFVLSGGFLSAVGSSGMAMAPSSSSTQYCVLVNFSSSQTANTLVHIQNEAGDNILSFIPAKTFQSVSFSTELLEYGETYQVYLGGSSSGTATDGLIEEGTYTAGTKYTSFTISGIITQIGSTSGPGGGGPGGGW